MPAARRGRRAGPPRTTRAAHRTRGAAALRAAVVLLGLRLGEVVAVVALRSLLLLVRLPLLLVLRALGHLRLPVVVLRLLRAGGRVRVALLEAAEAGLLPGQVLLGARPGAGLGALLLVVRVGGAHGRQAVVGRAAVGVLLVARGLLLGRRGLRAAARGLAHGVVDGDRDPDRAAALTAERVADQRGQAALQDALAPLVGDGEQRRVGDQGERLAALDPLLVLGLDALLALPEELLQHSWPHCGKIGRYVSHKARSLAGPTNVWFSGRDGRTGTDRKERSGSSHGSRGG